jgi:deoxyribonuclease-4
MGLGAQKGRELVTELLDEALALGFGATVLLETMAGKGTELGRSFEELASIIQGLKCPDKAGICLDTCHVNDAGYDLAGDLDGALEELDRKVGLSRLKAVHLNDSKNALGARKDRHAKIGEGALGLEALRRVLSHPRLAGLPFILETPNEPDGYALEIRLLREGGESQARPK